MKTNSSEFKALGTEIKIFLVSEKTEQKSKAEECIKSIKKIYQEKENIFNRFNPKSELSKINAHLGVSHTVSQDLFDLANKSLKYYQESNHYFDPRILEVLENIGYKNDFKSLNSEKHTIAEIPPILKEDLADDLKVMDGGVIFKKRMDFSGIAKGYITDIVSRFLISEGWQNFLIDSGGDIFAFGKNESGEDWKVEIEGVPGNKIIIKLKNSAVATSGITRRKWEAGGKKYHHLINPKNPNEFNFDLKSVTVVEKSCESADVLAKVLYLMGREEGIKHSQKENIKSIFLDYRGNVYLSSGVKEVIE